MSHADIALPQEPGRISHEHAELRERIAQGTNRFLKDLIGSLADISVAPEVVVEEIIRAMEPFSDNSMREVMMSIVERSRRQRLDS